MKQLDVDKKNGRKNCANQPMKWFTCVWMRFIVATLWCSCRFHSCWWWGCQHWRLAFGWCIIYLLIKKEINISFQGKLDKNNAKENPVSNRRNKSRPVGYTGKRENKKGIPALLVLVAAIRQSSVRLIHYFSTLDYLHAAKYKVLNKFHIYLLSNSNAFLA